VDTDPPFIPGLELSRYFYEDAVAPILSTHFPGLSHAVGLLGTGSEVLGFDTPRSMDHWWGPRVTIFLRAADFTPELTDSIRRVMADELPFDVRGFPTHMREVNRDTGTVFLSRIKERPINHMVYVATAGRFFSHYLGANPLQEALSPAQWLVMPEQHLRTVTSGGVWHDAPGELTRGRASLRWYPDDVWRYVLKAEWRRIEQEEAFPGRCAELGDELGSRIVAARLVRELMHLAFLLSREYMPYSKWLGTAFARLRCASELQPTVLAALAATNWPDRERSLSAAYETLATMQNELGLCDPVPATVSPFHGRPFQVIHGDRFAAALERTISDEAVKRLPRYLGNTTQWIDSTDVLSYPDWCASLVQLYG
jgi:hypothetical protein